VNGRWRGRALSTLYLLSLHIVIGVPPSQWSPSSSTRWRNVGGQLIFSGTANNVRHPPPTVRKKYLPVTCLLLPVPLWFLGCLLLVAMVMAAVGTTLGSCGEGAAPPFKTHNWEGDLTRGPFQAECVWSLMPQIPQGPQTSVCGKQSQPPTQIECWREYDRVWLCLTVAVTVSLIGLAALFPAAWVPLPHNFPVHGPFAPLFPCTVWEPSPISPSLCSHGHHFSQGVSVASWDTGWSAKGFGQSPRCVFWGWGGRGSALASP
jgi:hypothetical protein